MVPVMLNVVITALLAWRIYYAAPMYLDQLITIFGYETAWKVKPAEMGVASIAGTVMDRTFLLMIDYAIFGLLGSWPWEFVFGSKYNRYTGALSWRTTLGFQNVEIVVRTGRKWDTPLVTTERDKDKKWTLEDELSLKFKVEPAMRKDYTSKTGYLLLDKDWDLDFKAMIDAHQLVDDATLKLEDLDHIVLVFYQKQWLIWKVHSAADSIASKISAETAEEDVTLEKFKDTLIAMGREDVFFRWIEIVQYESSLPGGFSQGRQAEALRELRRLLTEKGVNYAKFWEEIGGQSGVPGLYQIG